MSRRINSLDHNSSRDSSGRRPVVRRVHVHSDTQRSLQEASAALENAFDHIRHVRHNLLRLTETFPEPLTTGSLSERDSVNPGHEALLLSGDTIIEEPAQGASNGATVTPGTRDVHSGANSTPPSISPTPNHPHPNTVVVPPTFVHAPPLPSVLPPRFSRQGIHGLPTPSPDSAATTHGLRVAAREAANPTIYNLRVAPRDPRSTALEYERLLAHHRVEINPVAWQGGPPNPDVSRATRERPDSMFAFSPPSLPVLYPASVPPNVYQHPYDSFMQTPDPSNRLNYLPLPPVPSHGRPTQRPLSGLPGAPRSHPTPANGVGLSDESFNVNTGLTENQFISWLSASRDYGPWALSRQDPYNPGTIRITRVNAPVPSRPDLQPRRRGWARLDPDGNEIPWDEEEELERSRMDYRLRVLQRTHEDSNGREILRHDGRTFHGSVLDSMLSVPAIRPRTNQWRSPTTDTQGCPFWVDPLPMPLSSMIMKEEHQDDYHPDVIVPRHACLAGR